VVQVTGKERDIDPAGGGSKKEGQC
jgi:hypothetical protein